MTDNDSFSNSFSTFKYNPYAQKLDQSPATVNHNRNNGLKLIRNGKYKQNQGVNNHRTVLNTLQTKAL